MKLDITLHIPFIILPADIAEVFWSKLKNYDATEPRDPRTLN